ncbi:unnamed protein product, partial [Ectocarpus sp. 13 AM-2016]
MATRLNTVGSLFLFVPVSLQTGLGVGIAISEFAGKLADAVMVAMA